MMLDDAYGSDLDRFPLEQEAAETELPELEWHELEVQTLALALTAQRTLHD